MNNMSRPRPTPVHRLEFPTDTCTTGPFTNQHATSVDLGWDFRITHAPRPKEPLGYTAGKAFLRFNGVAASRYTATSVCPRRVIDASGAVHEFQSSQWIAELQSNTNTVRPQPATWRHFAIYFANFGGWEFIADQVTDPNPVALFD